MKKEAEDILLYGGEEKIENCAKMVLPPPPQIFAAKVASLDF